MAAVQLLTPCKFWGKHCLVVCFSNSRRANRPLGVTKLERDVFDANFDAKKNTRSVDDVIEDEEEVRLVPQQWRFFQDDLHKSKTQKKMALRLRARQEELRRAEELRLKRQQLEEAGRLLKERLRQQRAVPNRDKNMEHLAVETVVESPATLLISNVSRDLKETKTVADSSESYLTSNCSRELEETSQSHQTSSKRKFDLEHEQLFSEDEIACLKRGAPEFTKLFCEKWPPLHALVAAGQFFFLDEYLKADLDLNFVDEDGYTPIHRAILGRKETAVSQLLRAGADPFIMDKEGASYLHYSTQTGSLNLVRLFVKCRLDVNHCDKDGWTALHIAVLIAREDIVRHLLFSGADKHLKTKDGYTPFDLCLAIGSGRGTFSVAKILKRRSKAEDSCTDVDLGLADMEPEVNEDATSEHGVDEN